MRKLDDGLDQAENKRSHHLDVFGGAQTTNKNPPTRQNSNSFDGVLAAQTTVNEVVDISNFHALRLQNPEEKMFVDGNNFSRQMGAICI